MAQENQLAHRVLSNMALPYVTNVSPSNTDPHFVSGSADVLTSLNTYAERRPGFATAVESTPTVFNNLQRLFTWDRTDGSFYIMACDINASNLAQVYKLAVGSDASFVSIYTGTSNVPFDFVVSNNTLYFSNGLTAQKWDPTNGLSNWGIAIAAVGSLVSAYASTGANGTGTPTWTNPTRIQGAPDSSFATNSLTVPAHSASTPPTGNLNATNYGFSIASTNTIAGIQITITGFFTQTGTGLPGAVTAQLLSGGTIIGSTRSISLPGSSGNVVLGGSSDLWGATITPAMVNSSTFGVALNCGGINASGSSTTYTFSLDAAQITVYQLGGPAISVSGSAGSFTATAGYQYEFCYGNSNTGHISSPTPPSNSTGVFTSKANVQVSLTASTDAQVNQIRLFRTTDGGGGTYFELPTSPYPNIGWTFTSVANASAGSTVYTGTFTGGSGFASSVGQSFVVAGFSTGANNGTFTCTASSSTTLTLNNASGVAETHAATGTLVALDAAADATLQVGSVAPTPTFNDPPTPGRGAVYFSGRIWMFTGNKVWFSGLEEINQGVPEESWPSGLAGNFWAFDQPVQGIAVAGGVNNQVLAIFTGGRIYGITGNTLDTFRRFTISQRRGCRSLATVTTLGGMCAWLDSANQIWASDGNTLQEISQDIRPDLATLTPSSCSMTFHTAGRFHWLVLSTGTKLFVYDVDTQQWMPPWNFAAQYVFSGEISPGNYVLMAATTTKALQMSTSNFNDNGVTYQPILKVSSLSVVPDYGSRFSYVGMGSYNEPTRTGWPDTFGVLNNGKNVADFLILKDEDPTVGTYQSIASQQTTTDTAFNRTNGTSMQQIVYKTTQPTSRWISMQLKLANADQVDNIYEMYMAYKGAGGR